MGILKKTECNFIIPFNLFKYFPLSFSNEIQLLLPPPPLELTESTLLVNDSGKENRQINQVHFEMSSRHIKIIQ